MLYSAKTYENALHGDLYGVFGDNIRFDYGKMVSRKKKVVRKLVLGVESKMKANKVTVIKGEAVINGRSSEGIEITSNGENILKESSCLYRIEASVPPIPGPAGSREVIVTNREILELTERPESLVFIGGGVIDMEFASFYNSLGTNVTVVEYASLAYIDLVFVLFLQ